jgi:hypothetical protein
MPEPAEDKYPALTDDAMKILQEANVVVSRSNFGDREYKFKNGYIYDRMKEFMK